MSPESKRDRVSARAAQLSLRLYGPIAMVSQSLTCFLKLNNWQRNDHPVKNVTVKVNRMTCIKGIKDVQTAT